MNIYLKNLAQDFPKGSKRKWGLKGEGRLKATDDGMQIIYFRIESFCWLDLINIYFVDPYELVSAKIVSFRAWASDPRVHDKIFIVMNFYSVRPVALLFSLRLRP